MARAEMQGHIAVIGRPNVGKSTLFNALLGKRRAITAAEAGVTRDIIDAPVNFLGRPLRLSDSGGLGEPQPQASQARRGAADNAPEPPLQLYRQVQCASLQILPQADILLWVVELGHFNAQDQNLLKQLQPFRHKVILVVNKVDAAAQEAEAYNFYRHGLPHLVMVSARQRRGLEQLQRQCLQLLPPAHPPALALASSPEAESELPRIDVTLIGKPNTGKSTLYNALVGAPCALVSERPGTTRDVLTQLCRRGSQTYQLMDTAGIRRKNKVAQNVEYFAVNRAFKSLDDVALAVLLLDGRAGLQQQDKKIAQQIIKRGRGLIFAVNKIDLLTEQNQRAQRQLASELRAAFPQLAYAPVCAVSALAGTGLPQLLLAINRVHQQLHKRINTGLLNQALQDWLRYYPPPSNGNARFKVRYLTQVETNPLRFILFVNRSKGFPASYVSFLQNQIRRELGFLEVPLQLHLHE